MAARPYLGVAHAEVELIGVAVGRFLAEGAEGVLLAVVVGGADAVVFFLFEEAEAGAGGGLGSFFVGYAFYGVAEGRHFGGGRGGVKEGGICVCVCGVSLLLLLLLL